MFMANCRRDLIIEIISSVFELKKIEINKAYNIIMYFQPFVYFIPESLCYLTAPQDAMILHQNEAIQRENQKKIESQQIQKQKRIKVYLDIFKEQIIKLQKSNSKKYWTEEEDNFLLNLNPNIVNWNQISQSIPGTNVAICKRRYCRLKEQLNKWPKDVDKDISKLFQEEKLSWPQVREQINKKYCQVLSMPKLSTNKIKERYMLYLRPGICKQEWTPEEDIEIIRVIKEYGKEWTKVLKNISLLQNRTELQLKNRYFGTLKFLQKKVERKVSAILKSKKTI